VKQDAGWFVLNARDAHWRADPTFGAYTRFEGDGEARFEQVGINIGVLQPGQPACLYHTEDNQEGSLVLSGKYAGYPPDDDADFDERWLPS